MAREDRSAVVRLYLASALQRLNHAARWSVASELVMHAEDAADQNLPKLRLARRRAAGRGKHAARPRASRQRQHSSRRAICRAPDC